MNLLKNVVLASGLLMGLVGGAEARAANWFAAVDVRNPTSETIKYHFRWGSDNDWKLFRLEPGDVRTHFWPYAHANQNSSPTPQVRFHYNRGETEPELKTYNVQAYAVSFKRAGSGKRYSFRYSRSGRYLDLYKD